MAHGIMPFFLAFFGDVTALEEVFEERVCVNIRSIGIFRDSHIVAFLRKVRCGQGCVGARNIGVSR